MSPQLPLFPGPLPDVDPMSKGYRKGFCLVSPGRRHAQPEPPEGLSRSELAGWLDGRDHHRVPTWRWELHDCDARLAS